MNPLILVTSLLAISSLAAGNGWEPPVIKVIHKTVHIPKHIPVPKIIHVPKIIPIPKTVAIPHPIHVQVSVSEFRSAQIDRIRSNHD